MDALAACRARRLRGGSARLRLDAARRKRVADARSRGGRRGTRSSRGCSSGPARRGQPIYLFGLSRGAMVAAMAAQQRPETLAGVVLLGFGFDPDDRSRASDPPARPARLAQHRRRRGVRLHHPRRLHRRQRSRRSSRPRCRADPVLVDWRDENQFNAFSPAQLQAPGPAVHGDRDPQAPVAIETKLFTRFGTARQGVGNPARRRPRRASRKSRRGSWSAPISLVHTPPRGLSHMKYTLARCPRCSAPGRRLLPAQQPAPRHPPKPPPSTCSKPASPTCRPR